MYKYIQWVKTYWHAMVSLQGKQPVTVGNWNLQPPAGPFTVTQTKVYTH